MYNRYIYIHDILDIRKYNIYIYYVDIKVGVYMISVFIHEATVLVFFADPGLGQHTCSSPAPDKHGICSDQN